MSDVTSRRVSAHAAAQGGGGARASLPHWHARLHALPCAPARAARHPPGHSRIAVPGGVPAAAPGPARLLGALRD